MAFINISVLLSVILMVDTLALSNQEADTDQYNEYIKNELISISPIIDHLIVTANTENNLMYRSGKDENNTNSKNNILKNELKKLKKNFDEVMNKLEHDTEDISTLQEELIAMSGQIEDLMRYLDDSNRDIKKELGLLAERIANVLGKLKDTQQEIENRCYKEFIISVRHGQYDNAATKLEIIEDDNKVMSLTITAYKNVSENLDKLIGFINVIENTHQRYLVYKALYTYLQSNENTNDNCEKRKKLSEQLDKDKKDENKFPKNMTELNDTSDAFNKFFTFFDPKEFFDAINCREYIYAAKQLSVINDCDKELIHFIIRAIREVNTFLIKDSLEFSASFHNPHLKYIAYKTVYQEVMKNGNELDNLFEQYINNEVKFLPSSQEEEWINPDFNDKMTELIDKNDPFNKLVYEKAKHSADRRGICTASCGDYHYLDWESEMDCYNDGMDNV